LPRANMPAASARRAFRPAKSRRARTRPAGPGCAFRVARWPAAGIPPLSYLSRPESGSDSPYFRKIFKKGKAGYPRFKPCSRFSQVGFVAGDGAKWIPAAAGGWARAAFQAVGSVKVGQHRPVPGTVKFLQLKREYRRWYVIVITDTEAEPLPATGRAVGVDVGVARFLTTSDGQVIANPQFLAAAAQGHGKVMK
jgi:hypothetical protein